VTYRPEDWPGPQVEMTASADEVDGHQVVTMRTTVPDEMRVAQIRMRPVDDDEMVVELRLRRITETDPRWGIIPRQLLDNGIVGD